MTIAEILDVTSGRKLAEAPETATKTRRQPPYAVILHNDGVNTFAYVINVLQTVFRYGFPRAFALTLRAHLTGRSIVWSGVLEVAELKAEQIQARGPDPQMIKRGAETLRVSVEPLPGD